MWCSPQVEEFSGGTSEQLSFNLVSLFLDTTGLKFMSLVSNLNELNRIRQIYFQIFQTPGDSK